MTIDLHWRAHTHMHTHTHTRTVYMHTAQTLIHMNTNRQTAYKVPVFVALYPVKKNRI